jgi:hypothetical protein
MAVEPFVDIETGALIEVLTGDDAEWELTNEELEAKYGKEDSE